MMKNGTALFLLLLGIALTGCGSGNVLLKGTVTFSDDGSPLSCGIVMFDNGIVNARGAVNPDGTFTVGSLKANDGLPPGEYRVSIVSAQILLPCPENEDDDPENNVYPPPAEQLIDKRYESFETSGLTVKVDPASKTYNISVERPSLDQRFTRPRSLR
jgi:hypothetical protein